MTTFKRSSYCSGGDCVQVAFDRDVRVRDSKNPLREPFIFTRDEWDAFTAGVKAGEFDTPAAED